MKLEALQHEIRRRAHEDWARFGEVSAIPRVDKRRRPRFEQSIQEWLEERRKRCAR